MLKKIIIFALAICSTHALEVNFQNLSAQFEQKITPDSEKSDSDNLTPSYKGDFVAQMPNKALWSYHAPLNKKVYVNENRVIIHEIELKQAQIGSMPEGLNFFEILKRAKKQDENKYLAKIGETTYTLELDSQKIKKISYKDELGNLVEIIFSNVRLDTKINTKIFDFTPDEQTDIIFLK